VSARIKIGSADVTEHVAAMFDALVNSLDWGSGFLDVETIESILIVAELAGFTVPEIREIIPPGLTHEKPKWEANANPLVMRARWGAYQGALRDAIAAWRSQVQARARALASDGES
jgi:hypothetical protein